MSDLLVVTNRTLCENEEAFLRRVELLAKAHPAGIILREKDLTEDAYQTLAEAVLTICRRHGTACILHNFFHAAAALGADAVHLPLPVLRGLSEQERYRFPVRGASCHSIADAIEAQRLGCTYITAGHIFETSCKQGLPGRGLDFLKQVCNSVSVPVYAIGGISAETIADVRKCGARGACVMSGAMVCENPSDYLRRFENAG